MKNTPDKLGRRQAAHAHRRSLPDHSAHARDRCAEREISNPVCELISTHGAYEPAECGRWRRQLNWHQLNQLARQGVDRTLLAAAVGASVIVPDDETLLITVMYDTRPRMAERYKSWRTSILGTPSKIRKAS
jgi:hypothetical protein